MPRGRNRDRPEPPARPGPPPGRDLQALIDATPPGAPCTLPPGTYPGGLRIRRPITLRGNGVVLDCRNADQGIRIDHAPSVTLEGVALLGARQYAVFAVYAPGLVVRGCTIRDAGTTGILTANSGDVTLESNEISGSRTQHGIYCSQSGDRLRIVGNHCVSCHGAGIQTNAPEGAHSGRPEEDWFSDACLIERNRITGCGAGGGAAINLMGVRRSAIRANEITGCLAGGISLWHDGLGAAYGCKDNLFEQNMVAFNPGQGRSCVSITQGSTGNRFTGNRLSIPGRPAIVAEEPFELDGRVMAPGQY